MKSQAYSSVTAFVAHWRALETADAQLHDDDRALLAALRDVLATLRPDERAALESDANPGPAARHRERAHASLARELRTRGLLAG